MKRKVKNEAMENPPDDNDVLNGANANANANGEDVNVRFKMPPQRGSPDTSDPARFHMPAQNPGCINSNRNRIENVTSNGNGNEDPNTEEEIETMDVSEPGPESGFEQNKMKDIIIVECQKLNGALFNGTINFSEAKIKIFKDGLGLDTALLAKVKILFNKCPVITFKLKSNINVEQIIKSQNFTFTRFKPQFIQNKMQIFIFDIAHTTVLAQYQIKII